MTKTILGKTQVLESMKTGSGPVLDLKNSCFWLRALYGIRISNMTVLFLSYLIWFRPHFHVFELLSKTMKNSVRFKSAEKVHFCRKYSIGFKTITYILNSGKPGSWNLVPGKTENEGFGYNMNSDPSRHENRVFLTSKTPYFRCLDTTTTRK